MKNNYWKYATIIFILLICFLSITLYMQSKNVYNFGGFEISKTTLNSLTSNIDTSQPFRLCDLQTSKCVILQGVSK